MLDVEARDLSAFAAVFRDMPLLADRAARMGINDTARHSRTVAAREMGDQINFPRGYLAPRNGRLRISKFASEDDLEAEITGRDRPTSLARFAVGKVKFGRNAGIQVQVAAAGGAVRINRGFFMRLRRGASFDSGNANVGLAVRLRPGETLTGSTAARDIGGGLYLLYGPSVDQVFRGVSHDILDDTSDYLADRFIHHFERARDGRL